MKIINKLDCLINDIQTREAEVLDQYVMQGTGKAERDETVSLGPEARKRVEEKVLRAIGERKGDTADKGGKAGNVMIHGGGRKRRFSRRFTVVLAAAMVLMLGITAMAASNSEWDIVLLNSMGISNPNTLQLESGEVQINQIARSTVIDKDKTQKPVTMTAVSSIGDRNTAYIRLQTDYEMPESYNPETDYVLPEELRIETNPARSHGASLIYFVEDNKLGFICEISNCEDLNRAEVSVSMENLYLYHDLHLYDEGDNVDRADLQNAPDKELLCEGSWDLSWKFRYESNTETYYKLKPLHSDLCTYYLTRIEISPISVRLEGFRKPEDREKPHEDQWLEAIYFEDGSVLELDGFSGAGLHNGIYADSYVGMDVLDEPIIPDKIEKLVIMGTEIEL